MVDLSSQPSPLLLYSLGIVLTATKQAIFCLVEGLFRAISTMTTPNACSRNCGSVDQVSELYVVSTEELGPGLEDYNVGVTYQFVRQEATRCVWERMTPGAFPWTFERLSRYPEGWAFPEIEPVPGVWTWRLSIDSLPLFLFHGWLANFPRIDDSVPDPSNNCSIAQSLETYVPLSLDGPAIITPTAEPVETPRPVQKGGPCFCFAECPPGTKPSRKYFVKTIGRQVIPFHEFGILYEIANEVGDFCEWQDVDLALEFSGFLTKGPVTPVPPATHAYFWDVAVLNTITAENQTYRRDIQWDFFGLPVGAAAARCDDARSLQSTPPVIGDFATIRPVPDWICTTPEAREWDDKYPLPIPTP